MQTKQRNSNIELFRIVMMLLIVAHHYVVNTGIMDVMAEQPTSWQSLFLYVFGMWGKIGINGFVLITGYFMCKSEITVRKFLKLLLEVLFYKIVIFTIFAIVGYQSYALADIVKGINPMRDVMSGFIGCFLVYYLFIPFLNKMLGALNRAQHRNLIILALAILMIWNHLPTIIYQINYVIWFGVLHVIAAYLRFYEKELSEKYSGLYNHLGLVTLSCVALAIGSVMLMVIGFGKLWPYKYVMDCDALLALPTSVALFVWFKSLSIPQSKFINTVASSTFAVLLIHAHSDAMRQWLWHDVYHVSEHIFTSGMPIYAISCVLLVFMVCIIIDKVRMFAFERPIFKVIDKILIKYGIK